MHNCAYFLDTIMHFYEDINILTPYPMNLFKTTSLIVATIFATNILSAQYVISTDSFDQALVANWSPPADGTLTSSASVTDSSLFATTFIGGFGNVDIYKTSGGNPSDWDQSSDAQTFSINVVGTPTPHGSNAGPRWRTIRSTANGNAFNGNWTDLSEGTNSLSFAGVAFDRYVGFQIAGVVSIDSFTHTYGSDSDTFSVSAVPEPSTYALLAGFAVFLFVAIKRRK